MNHCNDCKYWSHIYNTNYGFCQRILYEDNEIHHIVSLTDPSMLHTSAGFGCILFEPKPAEKKWITSDQLERWAKQDAAEDQEEASCLAGRTPRGGGKENPKDKIFQAISYCHMTGKHWDVSRAWPPCQVPKLYRNLLDY